MNILMGTSVISNPVFISHALIFPSLHTPMALLPSLLNRHDPTDIFSSPIAFKCSRDDCDPNSTPLLLEEEEEEEEEEDAVIDWEEEEDGRNSAIWRPRRRERRLIDPETESTKRREGAD